MLPRLLLITVLCFVATFPIGSAQAQQEDQQDEAKTQMQNVAKALAVSDYPANQCKWVDINADGWLDLILLDGGQKWRDAFLATAKLEALPEVEVAGAKARQISADAWEGDAADFKLFDFDGDGTLTNDELKSAMNMNRASLLLNVGADDGSRTFQDITAECGLRANHEGSSRGRLTDVLLAGDVDNDGDLDLFSGALLEPENKNWKQHAAGDTCCMLINEGVGKGGKFNLLIQDVPKEDDAETPKGPNAFPASVTSATFADVNQDGKLDLFLGTWYRQYGANLDSYQDRLYLGLGDGRFQDHTEAAGMLLKKTLADTLTDEEKKTGRIAPERRTEIGRGMTRPTYGVTAADWDNDGDQDLFVAAYGRQWNLHWENQGDGTFKEVGEKTHFDADAIDHGKYPAAVRRPQELPFRSGGNTFSIVFGDYDADGDLDALTGEITHGWAGEASDLTMILRNELNSERKAAVAEFTRLTDALPREREGLNWNQGDIWVAWIDIDNDSYLDAMVSSADYPDDQRLRIFRYEPMDSKFKDITKEIGLDWPWSTMPSLGDFDQDGDVDIAVGRSHMRLKPEQREAHPLGVAIWENKVADTSGNRWLRLKLVGDGGDKGSNPFAIGARIEVTLADGRTLIREVNCGAGHRAMQDDFTQTIGLGKLADGEVIKKVVVKWPRKESVTEWTDLNSNSTYTLFESGKLEKQ